MRQYLDYLQTILDKGVEKTDRTGTGTIGIFGHQMRFNLADGFPLVTTKKVHLKSVIHELLWLVAGDTNIKYLADNGVKIWDEWADENGDLGPVYGAMWRRWPDYQGGTIDQLQNALDALANSPDSRRIIVNSWNVALLPKMKLPPCHMTFQFGTEPLSAVERYELAGIAESRKFRGLYKADETEQHEFYDLADIPKYRLNCHLTQRSADSLLGVPFNIASYALLTHMVAQVSNMTLGEFVWTGVDCHIYSNHIEQVKLQLSREPLPLPTIKLNPNVKDLFEFKYEDFTLIDYQSHPAIKAPVAV